MATTEQSALFAAKNSPCKQARQTAQESRLPCANRLVKCERLPTMKKLHKPSTAAVDIRQNFDFRWKELCWNLGLQIVFARLMLYGLLPACILLGPGNIAWLDYWPPLFDKIVLVGSVALFALSVGSNLAISRYLRRHQTSASPYEYHADYIGPRMTDYFRIYVNDRTEFRAVLKSLRAQRQAKLLRIWLLFDNLWMLPAALMLVFGLAMMGFAGIVRQVRARHRPTS